MTYDQIDHTYCWNQASSACGQKIKHFECCLCKMKHPEIEQLTAERQRAFSDGYKQGRFDTTMDKEYGVDLSE